MPRSLHAHRQTEPMIPSSVSLHRLLARCIPSSVWGDLRDPPGEKMEGGGRRADRVELTRSR